MDAIDWRDVKEVLTEEQLRRGANGIAYRVEQLVYGTLVLTQASNSQELRELAARNALVESGLVHGRALAYFLTAKKHNDDDLHISHFSKSVWRAGSSKITRVAEDVIDAASRHLAHASVGGQEWEPHAGDWPLPEMAVIFSRGVNDFVEAVAEKRPDLAALFGETPLFEYANLEAGGLSLSTTISDHPEVGALTETLQAHLAPTGWPGVVYSRAARPDSWI